MRILFVTPFYSPSVAGSSRLYLDIAEFLHKRGHEFSVLTFGLDDPQKLAAHDALKPYPIYRVFPKRHVPGSVQMFFRCLRLARSGHYDLLISGVAYFMGILVSIVARLSRVPAIVYCLGEDVSVVFDSFPKRTLLRQALLSSARLIAISKFTSGSIVGIGIPASRISLVHPGIDPAPYIGCAPAAVEQMRDKFGLTDKKVILTVARLSSRKGHDMIVRTLSKLSISVPNLHYLIVGLGDTKDLSALAESEKVADRITFVPYISDEDLPVLYNLPDVYAMVSRTDPATKEVEGFGIVYLEAAASGKPCVAGSQGGSPDAVDDGVTGFVVDPTSVEEIYGALHALLTNDAKAHEMGQAGRERVERQFTKSRMLASVEEIIVDACKTPASGNSIPK